MSPERLTAVETADAQCDIWSFGVTFHEWISGRHPFFHEDGNRMIGNIMDNAPADLAGVTGSLHRLIRQTLEKDPGSRYRNFAELIADLKPIARELQRDESDAMLAEALKQTDSGQWYEARRIAREMRADKPAKPAASQFFGVPQPGAETDQIPEPTGIPVNPPLAAAAAVGASSGPRPIVETPPAPVPVPPPTLRESKPEFNPAKPLFEDGGSQLPVPIPRPTVRILAAEESSGFPLGKVAAFAVAAMLVAGVLLFLWGPYSGVVGKGELSAEAKAINPPGNVVKANRDVADVSPATTALDDDSALAQPRPFDPKSLTASKSIPTLPVRLRPNTTATLKPPPLSQSTLIGDLVVWPGAVKAPPPPAPAPAALVVNNPPAEKPRPQSAEAAQAAAVRVGGSFSQPVLVHSVPPAYPPSALERKAQGVVRFEATITKDGSVANLQVVSGDPLLDVAAKNAVLQWKYQPALLNGEPVEVTQSIVVKFNLSQ
jgi:TonB family protein